MTLPRIVALFALLTACERRAAEAPPTAPLVIGASRAPERPPPASRPPVSTGPDCGSSTVRVVLEDSTDLPCFPDKDCTTVPIFTILNCGERLREVEAIASCDPIDCIEYAPTLLVPPRSHTILELSKMFRLGAGFVRVTTREVGDVAPYPSSVHSEVRFTFVDPLLAKAKAECAASGGDFGRWGMLGTEACVPVMHDEGRRCSDARQCEGYCVQRKRVHVTKGWDRVTGQCSRHRLRFGCHTFIGETKGGLVPSIAQFVHMCVD